MVGRQQTFNVGTTITIDFTMLVAGSQRPSRCAEAPVPAATNSTVSALFKRRKSSSLPVINRNFSDLAALAPGVQASGGGVSIGSSFASQTATASTACRRKGGIRVDRWFRSRRTGSRNSPLSPGNFRRRVGHSPAGS